MDAKGQATDNICIERFWRSAKCERIYLNQYAGLVELRDDVADYIDFIITEGFMSLLIIKKLWNFITRTYWKNRWLESELNN